MIEIYPSLIAGNLVNLEHDIIVLEPYCDGFHLDIMDFHFVPNLTMGPDFVNAIRKTTKKPLWVHLMIDNPTRFITRLELHKNDSISVHYEGLDDTQLKLLFNNIHHRLMKAGLAIKPATAIEVVKPFFGMIDHVLLMSVEPGFSGQTLCATTYERLAQLRDLRDEHSQNFTLALDGGITHKNIAQLATLGAQRVSVASAIFHAHSPVKALQELRRST